MFIAVMRGQFTDPWLCPLQPPQSSLWSRLTSQQTLAPTSPCSAMPRDTLSPGSPGRERTMLPSSSGTTPTAPSLTKKAETYSSTVCTHIQKITTSYHFIQPILCVSVYLQAFRSRDWDFPINHDKVCLQRPERPLLVIHTQ